MLYNFYISQATWFIPSYAAADNAQFPTQSNHHIGMTW